jgi:hypothetical protein
VITRRGDRTLDHTIKSRTLYQTELGGLLVLQESNQPQIIPTRQQRARAEKNGQQNEQNEQIAQNEQIEQNEQIAQNEQIETERTG